MSVPVLRVIGVGNDLRGDDGVGPETVRRLRARAVPGIEATVCAADPAALIEAWAGAARAVVVDAMAGGGRPGARARFDAVAAPLPVPAFRGSTHGLGVAEAVELARALSRLPASLIVIGVEGARWDAGAPLGPEADEAVDRVVDDLVKEAPEFD